MQFALPIQAIFENITVGDKCVTINVTNISIDHVNAIGILLMQL